MDNQNQDVKQVVEPSTSTAAPVAPVADTQQEQKPPKGFVPYEALKEERDARKALEDKLEKLSAPPETGDVFSDEGKALKGEISSLGEKLRIIEKREQRREAEIEFPFLKDKKTEFDEYLEDDENKGISIKKAAKLFAAERGLVDTTPSRKGLEKPTGGGQSIPVATITKEEVADLMKNNYKRYETLLREGKIPFFEA